MKGQTAPGDVEDRRIAARSGWGNLPEKEQAQAEQEIGRNFPPHYREALKKYFEKLAKRKNSK